MLEIFALIVLVVLIAAAIWLIVILGNLPGKMAREAEHPQTEAIMLLGWFGLLTLGVGWLVAIVWAKTQPILPTANVEQRVKELEAKVASLEEASA